MKVDGKALTSIFKNKVILVTGGTGSIGKEIVKQLLSYEPKQIRVYSRDESKHFLLEEEIADQDKNKVRSLIGDIRDKERLDIAFTGVDFVFHAAALKHVPYCEYNPFEAVKTNVLGTQNLIDLAIKHRVKKFIAISTDKAVYPNNVMGISKLLMERLVVGAYNHQSTQFCVVRFGNVLNSRGSVVPTWIRQIKKGGPVTVTDKKMRRFFMSIPQAVSLVLNASYLSHGGEIFVLKMKEVSIYQFAKTVVKKYSPTGNIKIKIIGRREKEKITEELFTQEEKENIIEATDFFVIIRDQDLLRLRKKDYTKRKYRKFFSPKI